MRVLVALLCFLVTAEVLNSAPRNCVVWDHVAWVQSSMTEMAAVKVGMTRADVERVFTTEGGISTPAQKTYIYRSCPYFKVDDDVEFSATGGQQAGEDPHDRVVKISAPYLAWPHTD